MNPEDLSIEELQKLLSKKMIDISSKDKSNVTPDTSENDIAEDFTVNRAPNKARKSAVKASKNQFVDEGEDKDIETPNVKPTPRNRRPPKKVQKTCHVCGKKFEILASLVSGEYIRCNRCIGR